MGARVFLDGEPRRSRAHWVDLVNAHLSAGLTQTETAKQLRISRQFVSELVNDPTGEKERARKDRYRRPCPRCGRRMTGSEGLGTSAPKLCSVCTHAKRSAERKWTREAVLDAVRRWALMNGRPPTASEWQRAAVWHDGDGAFETPPASNLYRSSQPNAHFDSWADAIEAAGFPRPRSGVYERTSAGAGATERVRAIVGDGWRHTTGELLGRSGARTSTLSYLVQRGELVRIATGVYVAGPNLLPEPGSLNGGVTAGSERCRCTVKCEFPCWQRLGIADACGLCGCPPFEAEAVPPDLETES